MNPNGKSKAHVLLLLFGVTSYASFRGLLVTLSRIDSSCCGRTVQMGIDSIQPLQTMEEFRGHNSFVFINKRHHTLWARLFRFEGHKSTCAGKKLPHYLSHAPATALLPYRSGAAGSLVGPRTRLRELLIITTKKGTIKERVGWMKQLIHHPLAHQKHTHTYVSTTLRTIHGFLPLPSSLITLERWGVQRMMMMMTPHKLCCHQTLTHSFIK